jgi:hypothetical protein
MRTIFYCICLVALIAGSCGAPVHQPTKKKAVDTFVLRETLVTGLDTAMKSLSGFRKKDIRDELSQHWELQHEEHVSSIELVLDEKNIRIFPELILFKDGEALENPRSHFRAGTWQVTVVNNRPVLTLHFAGNKQKKYFIREINSQNLWLVTTGIQVDSLYIRLSSDALIHQNKLNDPFYPANNLWRIKPAKPETEDAIKARVLQCIKFYALFFRDNIKRQKKEINFLGLPRIFEWYRRGIGLPDKKKIHESWVHCFYNKEQAIKGYNLLRALIVDYEFNWPKGAPNWVYETHSVLEQMYHKLNEK